MYLASLCLRGHKANLCTSTCCAAACKQAPIQRSVTSSISPVLLGFKYAFKRGGFCSHTPAGHTPVGLGAYCNRAARTERKRHLAAQCCAVVIYIAVALGVLSCIEGKAGNGAIPA